MGATEDLALTLTNFGLPAESASSVLAAVDAAGYDLNGKGSPPGTAPTPVLETADAVRVLIRGIPNAWLAGVKVGERGWFTWMEFQDKEGGFTRTQPVFSSGGGRLLLRPRMDGRYTVGGSAIEGPDLIR
jgi:hypothetical protein